MEPPSLKRRGVKKVKREAEHQHNPTQADTGLGQQGTLNYFLRDLPA